MCVADSRLDFDIHLLSVGTLFPCRYCGDWEKQLPPRCLQRYRTLCFTFVFLPVLCSCSPPTAEFLYLITELCDEFLRMSNEEA